MKKANYKRLCSLFTTDTIVVDGIADEAYLNAEKSLIINVKDGSAPKAYSGKTTTSGVVQSVWDGRTLYIFVDVTDNTPSYNSKYAGKLKLDPIGDGDAYSWLGSDFGDKGSIRKSTYNIGDAVEFSIDFWNDKVSKFQDDDGLFSITRDGYLTYYYDAMVNNHSSVYAHKDNREFNNRIKAWAVSEKDDGSGYCVELALELYAWDHEYNENGYLKAIKYPIKNGNCYGVDIMIGDAPVSDSGRSTRLYWSHSDDCLPFSSKDFNADWGEIILTGWNSEAFTFNDWNLTNAIRYTQSSALQKGVWSEASQKELDDALLNAKAVVGSKAQSIVDAAADRLIIAICSLRRKNIDFPDPLDLKACFTLPNVYRFFTQNDILPSRIVKTHEDWEARRKEILALAQFYEYGRKPERPDKLVIESIVYTQESIFSFATWKNEKIAYYKITITITYGSISASTYFRLELPSKTQIKAAGRTGKMPVMLSFDAAAAEYLEAGFAVLTIPTGDITDDRNAPWSGRSGFLRNFFPYERTSADEISNEMAAAWECSIAIDTLEKLVFEKYEIGEYSTADKLLAADKLAVTGFSIFGKYAFVSAVFDERIGVCIPSAAGCTGPSLYRYVTKYKEGLIWSWGVSDGCEVLGDTIRHKDRKSVV